MTKTQRVKRKIIIVIGLSLSAYLMYGGMEILNKDVNTTSKVHTNTMQGTVLADYNAAVNGDNIS